MHAVWPVQKTWLGLAKCPGKHGSCIPWIWSSCMTEWNNFMNSYGDVANLKGRQVNWYTLPFTLKQRYFHAASHRDVKVCILQIYWNCPFALLYGRPDRGLCLPLEVLYYKRLVEVRKIYDRLHVISHLFRDEQQSAEEALRLQLTHRFNDSLEQQLMHCLWKLLGTVPFPKCEWFLGEERSSAVLHLGLSPPWQSLMPGNR